MAFNRCCAKAEICPKPTKEPALSSLPSYTTRTFAKPHPITPCAPKIPDISEGNRSIIEPRALTSGVDKKKEFQEALMAHLARKARGYNLHEASSKGKRRKLFPASGVFL